MSPAAEVDVDWALDLPLEAVEAMTPERIRKMVLAVISPNFLLVAAARRMKDHLRKFLDAQRLLGLAGDEAVALEAKLTELALVEQAFDAEDAR